MEIEIKARIKDKELIRNKLAKLGAERKKEKHQIDEYYGHPSRDIRKTNEYIRIRHQYQDNKGIFCYHQKMNEDATKEYEVGIDNVEVFKNILGKLGFGKLGTIDKNRETFVLDEFVITLDEVKNVGSFMEIETEGEIDEAKEKKAGCIGMLKKLGMGEDDLCNVWLCDIATGMKKNGN